MLAGRFILVILLALPAGIAVAAAAALTEAEAVRRGLAHPELTAMHQARIGEAIGAAAATGRWPNPEIELSREEVDGSSGRSDETDFWIRQRLDFAGVRARERDAARTLVVAAEARADMAEREQAREIRRKFYDVLAADALLGSVAGWHDRLDLLVASTARRVEAGDASRYELLRLQKEHALVKSERLERQSEAESARGHLFSMLGQQPAKLSGMLLPAVMDQGAVPGLADHPVLRALEAEGKSALLGSEAASRRAWPSLTLGAGWRKVDEGGHSADGGMFMLGVEIPVFDRGAGDREAAASRARASTAERRLASERLEAQARSALGELRARRAAALLLAAPPPGADSLVAIAEAAYEAGEIGVAELIDAHRTELAVAREHIHSARAARESHIELQYLGGEP